MRKNEKKEDTFRAPQLNSDLAARDPHIVVIGGGVAGTSAAIELAERGMRVTLLEAADTIGGKVKGWRDPEGYSIEHGLHGWWMDYTNFRDLIARVGLTANLTEPIDPFTVIHRDGIVDRLTFSRLPSPFHITGMMEGLRSVGLRGKLSTVSAGLAIVGFDPEDEYRELDRIDFSTWMRSKGISSQAAQVIFEPTLRSNLFLPIEQTSAAAGINAILRGLRRRDSWRFSWMRGNTGDYLWKPIAAHMEKHGVQIRLRTQATGFQLEGDKVKAVLISDSGRDPVALSADYVILAVDIESCKKLILASLNHIPFFNRIFNLSATDVLVTRTWFEGDVRPQFHDGMLLGFRIVDAFIDVTRIQPEIARPGTIVIETQSYLGKQWMHVPEATISELILRDLTEVIPELENTNVIKTIVIRHTGEFAAFGLGFETFRPSISTPVTNLHLAGDWIRAPEPVMFMENAIVTGRHAASAVLEHEGYESVPIIPPFPPDAPVVVIHALVSAMRKTKRGIQRLIGFIPIGEEETA